MFIDVHVWNILFHDKKYDVEAKGRAKIKSGTGPMAR